MNKINTLRIIKYPHNVIHAVPHAETQREQIEMNENVVYGVSIAAPELKEQPQVLESVSMSINVCYTTVTMQGQL